MYSIKTAYTTNFLGLLGIILGFAPYYAFGAARSDIDYFVVPGSTISRLVVYDNQAALSHTIKDASVFGPFTDKSNSFAMILNPAIIPSKSRPSWVKMPLKASGLQNALEYFLFEYTNLIKTTRTPNYETLNHLASLLKVVEKEALFEEEMIKKILSDELQKNYYHEDFLECYQQVNASFLDNVQGLLQSIEKDRLKIKTGNRTEIDYQKLVTTIKHINQTRYALDIRYSIENSLRDYTEESIGVLITDPRCKDLMREILASRGYQRRLLNPQSTSPIHTTQQLEAVINELHFLRETSRRPSHLIADPAPVTTPPLAKAPTVHVPVKEPLEVKGSGATVTPLVTASPLTSAVSSPHLPQLRIAVGVPQQAPKNFTNTVITAADIVKEKRQAWKKTSSPEVLAAHQALPERASTIKIPTKVAPVATPVVVAAAAQAATPAIPAATPMSRAQRVAHFVRTPLVAGTLVTAAFIGIAVVAFKSNAANPRTLVLAAPVGR